MYRAFTANITLHYLDLLPKLVQGYNASFHRSNGIAPGDVRTANDVDAWKTPYGKRLLRKPSYKFQATDKVHLRKVRRNVQEDLPTRVDRRSTSVIRNSHQEYDGTLIKGKFYSQRTQATMVRRSTKKTKKCKTQKRRRKRRPSREEVKLRSLWISRKVMK